MSASLVILCILGILLVGAVGLVVFLIIRSRSQSDQAVRRAKLSLERQQSAVWAGATVVSARGGIVTGSDVGVSQWARYDLSLQVTPPGGAPYLAHTAWLVQVAQVSLVEPGRQLSVKIDQQDLQIIYPNGDWAKYIPD